MKHKKQRWRGKRGEMYYVVSIPGFAKLGKERDEVLENLAVSNIELQDKIYQQLDYKVGAATREVCARRVAPRARRRPG